MGAIITAQYLVLLVLGAAALGLEVWALVEAVRLRKAAYAAAGKQTKVLWVSVLAVGTAIGFLALPAPGPAYINVLGFLSIAAAAAAGGFLAGVRPAVRAAQGRGGRSSGGPYGGW